MEPPHTLVDLGDRLISLGYQARPSLALLQESGCDVLTIKLTILTVTVYSIWFVALLDVACLHMYICQCNTHIPQVEGEVEGEVKGGFIAVHAMKSTVEGRGRTFGRVLLRALWVSVTHSLSLQMACKCTCVPSNSPRSCLGFL